MDPEFAALYEASLMQRKATDTEIPPLGSGSDFIAFLQYLGVRPGKKLPSGVAHEVADC